MMEKKRCRGSVCRFALKDKDSELRINARNKLKELNMLMFQKYLGRGLAAGTSMQPECSLCLNYIKNKTSENFLLIFLKKRNIRQLQKPIKFL
jgi:carbamate kinase